MRKKSASAILAAVFVGLFAGAAGAQDLVKATVPFAFEVRGKTLPAGTYEIRNDEGLLFIWSTTTRAVAFVLSHPADGRDPAGANPALVFTASDGAYVLTQVWEPEGDGLAVVPPSTHARHATPETRTSTAPVVVAATVGH